MLPGTVYVLELISDQYYFLKVYDSVDVHLFLIIIVLHCFGLWY